MGTAVVVAVLLGFSIVRGRKRSRAIYQQLIACNVTTNVHCLVSRPCLTM